MYDVIVLGASFAGAGIASRLQTSCLVVEESLRAGYEFFAAFAFGTGWEKLPTQSESRALREAMLEKGEISLAGDRHLYPYFRGCDILFGTRLFQIEREKDSFLCTLHNAKGFSTLRAKRIVDTRASERNSRAKSYNLLLEGGEVFSLPVPLTFDFVKARAAAFAEREKRGEEKTVLLSAEEFDYHVKQDASCEKDGILYFPSKAFENPFLAFDAGLLLGEELTK